jgi:hypothetical protein
MHVKITHPAASGGEAHLDIPLDEFEQITQANELLEFMREYLSLFGITYAVTEAPTDTYLRARIMTDYEIPMGFEVYTA